MSCTLSRSGNFTFDAKPEPKMPSHGVATDWRLLTLALSVSVSQHWQKTLRNVASRFSLRVNSISIRTSFESFLSFLFRVFFVYFTLRPGAAQYQLATTMRMLYFSHLRLESVFKICDNTVNAHVCFFSTNLQMYTEITRENRCPQPFPLQNQNIHPPLVWRLYKKKRIGHR